MGIARTPKRSASSGAQAPRVARSPSIITLRSWVREGLGYIVGIAEVKGSLKVKPKDLATYLGVRDRHALVRLGRVLALLRDAGLATYTHSPKVRPKRYKLVPRELWRRFVEECSRGRFRCETGEDCPLAGECPYWRALEYLAGSAAEA